MLINKLIKMKISFPAIIFSAVFATAPSILIAQNSSDNEESQEQNVIVIQPLFEYPSAPEDLDWISRSNWLMEHFWDNFDTKQSAVGQIPLNHAFKTWCVPLRFADKDIAFESLSKLLKRLEKNPTLLLQFTKAAEYNIYNPSTAEIWADDFYIPIIEALIANKKVPKIQKARYTLQIERLKNCKIGSILPQFSYRDLTGQPRTFDTGRKYMILEFGDPDCIDCQMTRISIKQNDLIKRLVDEDVLGIGFLIPDSDPEDTDWMESLSGYPENWIVGAASELDDIFDLRLTPSLYFLSPQGIIMLKNTDEKTIVNTLGTLFNDSVPSANEGAPATESTVAAPAEE